uniref:Palmitoyltransferase n=1 Tax=Strongyloides stercoralis TaxID=6248 RepID=A0AAF5D380_STRER
MTSCQFDGSFFERNYLYIICKLITTFQRWLKVKNEKTLLTKAKCCAKKMATTTGDTIINGGSLLKDEIASATNTKNDMNVLSLGTSLVASPNASDASLIIKTGNINLDKNTKELFEQKLICQKSDINFEIQDQKRNKEIDENLKKRLNEAVEIVSQLENVTDWNFNLKKTPSSPSSKYKDIQSEVDYIEKRTTVAKNFLESSK